MINSDELGCFVNLHTIFPRMLGWERVNIHWYIRKKFVV